MAKTAITPTRNENFSDWYQSVISGAEMAEDSVVRGCMVIKPWGYALWEKMQNVLDTKFKETGHQNAYFPLLIPLSFLEKEAEHVEGFAKECAVVTHHRLEIQDGKMIPAPDSKLEEPFVIRPTSETIIGESFSKWVQSYRDLPILINQWANVMRWEMRTRKFLRTSEFLWQEGHTAHATAQEAKEETLAMLKIYQWFLEEYLAMPVYTGEKTPEEKFPGAENTYTLEALMQSKKALQAGTSHYMGQNFAKGSDITFTNKNGEQEHAYTTSWGVSTRMIGGLIMAHSDDDGLVLPPRIAPQHGVILPLLGKGDDEKVLDTAYRLKKEIEQMSVPWAKEEKIQIIIDQSEKNPGQKNWDWVRKGIPLRITLGPKDIEKNSFVLQRRDKPSQEKEIKSIESGAQNIPELLEEIQKNIFTKAQSFQQQSITEVSSIEEFKTIFTQKEDPGFVLCYAEKKVQSDRESLLKELKVTARCIPFQFNTENPESHCIFSGQKTSTKILYARAY